MNSIKALREARGISQKEFAIDLGVAQPTVSDWENGKKTPRGNNLKAIAEYFGVSPSMVLGYEAESKPISPLTMSSEDVDAWYIRERLRRDPTMRVLFDAADKARPEHLLAAAAMLKALESPTFPKEEPQEFKEDEPQEFPE